MAQRRAASSDRWREDRFRQIHGAVGELVAGLIIKSLDEQRDNRAFEEVPLLTRRGWIPPQPLSVDRVRLKYAPPRGDRFTEAKSVLAPYWPRIDGMRVPTYSAAVKQFAQPQHFFDGASFRLLGFDSVPGGSDGGRTELTFTRGSYYDWYDSGEALSYEAALRYKESGGATVSGRYRAWLASPFDFARRCAIPGVNTLTVRTSGRGSNFYLHRRTHVATARGTVHVVPAGEFQPSGGHPGDEAHGGEDLDLKSTIIREYAEELLGAPDVNNPQAHHDPIDFAALYADVESALRGGGARLHYLGTGLYPLTWKPEILMVCVFEDRLFDQVFADMERSVDEGDLEGPGGRPLTDADRLPGARNFLFGRKQRPYQGLPFNEETVQGYANDPTTLPAARACLKLAWRHREFLNIRVAPGASRT